MVPQRNRRPCSLDRRGMHPMRPWKAVVTFAVRAGPPLVPQSAFGSDAGEKVQKQLGFAAEFVGDSAHPDEASNLGVVPMVDRGQTAE